MATGIDVGRAPGATASAGGTESEWTARAGSQPGVRPSWSVRGRWGGLTLARAKALDGDGQALATGDGPQLALVAVGHSIRPTDLGAQGKDAAGEVPPHAHHRLHAPALTLVAVASGQVDVGHTQRAEPASSTQDAPNSQRISAHVSGAKESGGRQGDPAGSGGLAPRTAPPLARGAKVSASLGSHLFHSHQGPGRGHLDTARTWVRPPQAYMSTARSSAHSHLAQRPGGHSCRLGGRGKKLRSAPGLPTGSRAWPTSCLVWVRPGSEQVRQGAQ